MLEKLAVYKEKTEALKSKIRKAMMYPTITLVIASIVTVILLVKVVPTLNPCSKVWQRAASAYPSRGEFIEWMQANYLLIIIALPQPLCCFAKPCCAYPFSR